MRVEVAKLIEDRAISHAKDLAKNIHLREIERKPDTRHGFMRGLEYYGGAYLIRVLSNSILNFFLARKRFPRHPLRCETLGEKIFWSKFIVPLPLPTPANRLIVGEFIPPGMCDKIRVSKVVWESNRADLPADLRAPPGGYYLKSNHAWKTARRIALPYSATDRAELAEMGRNWLGRKAHNFNSGEWWYSTISPKLYIEEEIVNELDEAMEFNFYTIEGKVVVLIRKKLTNYADGLVNPTSEYISIYGDGFRHMVDASYKNSLNPATPAPLDIELMYEAAGAIGSPFEFARIDLYNPSPGVVYLGEITLCPTAGNGYFSPQKYEYDLGSAWDLGKYVRPQ